jgi:IclR family pca regulon transcriptional regulator
MTENREPRHFIESLSRGIKILECFSPDRPYLSLQDLSNHAGLNKTAVQRLTDTFMKLGLIGRNDHKEFFLEPRILTLGYAYLKGSELPRLGETHVRDFGKRIGRTVNLAVLDGSDVLFLFRHEVKTFFKFNLQEGSRLPAHCTSLGKVLLAALNHNDLEQQIRKMKFEALTSYTITNPKAFREEIALTRSRGYGVSNQEGTLGLFSVAAPLINHEGRTVAAVNMSLTIEEAENERFPKLVEELLSECERWSMLLGYEGLYPWPGASLDTSPLPFGKKKG